MNVVEALCCGRLMPAWRVSLDGWCLDCAEVLTGCGDVP